MFLRCGQPTRELRPLRERCGRGRAGSRNASLSLRASKRSTCGKPGAVTCCKATAKGKQSCSIKAAADKCTPPKGGSASVGASATCHDACLPALSALVISEEQVNAAASIGLSGLPDPWGEGFELAILRTAAELGARVETTSVPAGPSASAIRAGDWLHNQCPGFYCGPAKPENLNPILVGSCLNRACFNHDLCSFEACVRFDPRVTSPRSRPHAIFHSSRRARRVHFRTSDSQVSI
jgi:hypothetical protein